MQEVSGSTPLGSTTEGQEVVFFDPEIKTPMRVFSSEKQRLQQINEMGI